MINSTYQTEEVFISKFQQDATLLLEAVGGKENISAVTPLRDADAFCAGRSEKGGYCPH